MPPNDVTATLHLTEPQALALAQLARRFQLSSAEALGFNRDQASVIVDGVIELQAALADAGYPAR